LYKTINELVDMLQNELKEAERRVASEDRERARGNASRHVRIDDANLRGLGLM